MSHWWPLAELRLTTPRLELRMPTDSDLEELAGLGASYATSGAFTDNLASQGVSRKLGYVDDGIERQVRRGQSATLLRLRLDRETWKATRTVPVDISGLEPCLAMFGVGGGHDSAEPVRP